MQSLANGLCLGRLPRSRHSGGLPPQPVQLLCHCPHLLVGFLARRSPLPLRRLARRSLLLRSLLGRLARRSLAPGARPQLPPPLVARPPGAPQPPPLFVARPPGAPQPPPGAPQPPPPLAVLLRPPGARACLLRSLRFCFRLVDCDLIISASHTRNTHRSEPTPPSLAAVPSPPTETATLATHLNRLHPPDPAESPRNVPHR